MNAAEIRREIIRADEQAKAYEAEGGNRLAYEAGYLRATLDVIASEMERAEAVAHAA